MGINTKLTLAIGCSSNFPISWQGLRSCRMYKRYLCGILSRYLCGILSSRDACYPPPVCLTFPHCAGVGQVRLFRSCYRKYPVEAEHFCFLSSLSSSLNLTAEIFSEKAKLCSCCLSCCSVHCTTLVFPHFTRFPICLKMYDMFSSFLCCFILRKSNRARIPFGARIRIKSLVVWGSEQIQKVGL